VRFYPICEIWENLTREKCEFYSTWMCDCLLRAKPSRYVTIHLDQLSLPSLDRLQPCCEINSQESLANAKVSARQSWYIRDNSLNRPPLSNILVYFLFQCATIPSLTMRVYLHLFSRCCLPKMPSNAKFWKNLNLQQFKVIQGRWFLYQSKAHIRVPISD